MALNLPHRIDNPEFFRAKAFGGYQRQVIQPAIGVFICRQIVGVTVASGYYPSVGLSREYLRVSPVSVSSFKLPAKDAHEIPPHGLRHRQGLGGERQD